MNRPLIFLMLYVLFLFTGIFADALLGGWMPWFNSYLLLRAVQMAMHGTPIEDLPQFMIGQESLGGNALWIGILLFPLFYGIIAFVLVELQYKFFGPKKIDINV